MSNSESNAKLLKDMNEFYNTISHLQNSIRSIADLPISSSTIQKNEVYECANAFVKTEITKLNIILSDTTVYQTQVNGLNEDLQKDMLKYTQTYVDHIKENNEEFNKNITASLDTYYQTLYKLSSKLTENLNTNVSSSATEFSKLKDTINRSTVKLSDTNTTVNGILSDPKQSALIKSFSESQKETIKQRVQSNLSCADIYSSGIETTNINRPLLLDYLNDKPLSLSTMNKDQILSLYNDIMRYQLPAKSELSKILQSMSQTLPTSYEIKTIRCKDKFISFQFYTYLKGRSCLSTYYSQAKPSDIHIDHERKLMYIDMNWNYYDFISDYILNRNVNVELLKGTPCDFNAIVAELKTFGFSFSAIAAKTVNDFCTSMSKLKVNNTNSNGTMASSNNVQTQPTLITKATMQDIINPTNTNTQTSITNTSISSSTPQSTGLSLLLSKPIESSILSIPSKYNKNSILLTGEYDSTLKSWFSNKAKLSLIFKATVDGSSGKKFHEKCNGISPTFVLIHVKNVAGYDCLFGGYTTHSWKACPKVIDNNAFVYTLKNHFKTQPMKFGVKKGSICVVAGTNSSPIFGNAGIYLRPDPLTTDTNYIKNLSSTYDIANPYGENIFVNQLDKSGTITFKVEDYEVYHVSY